MLRFNEWTVEAACAEIAEVHELDRREAARRARLELAAHQARRQRHLEEQRRSAPLHVRGYGRAKARRSSAKPSATTAKTSVDDGDPDPASEQDASSKSKHEQIVIVVPTRNKKLGKGIWATTLPVHQTCPSSCPLLDNGCYGQRGPGGHVARLERNAKRQHLSALDIAREEAHLIRERAKEVPSGTPLRLHVSGDCGTAEAAKIVADACRDWPGPVWTFTHAWREVPRSAWGSVSVFASIEDPNEALEAIRRGYAPALVVAEHPANGRSWIGGGVRFIPCLFETRGLTCANCRLCFAADRMVRNKQGIAFAAHGSGKERVKQTRLVQLGRRPEACWNSRAAAS